MRLVNPALLIALVCVFASPDGLTLETEEPSGARVSNAFYLQQSDDPRITRVIDTYYLEVSLPKRTLSEAEARDYAKAIAAELNEHLKGTRGLSVGSYSVGLMTASMDYGHFEIRLLVSDDHDKEKVLAEVRKFPFETAASLTRQASTYEVYFIDQNQAQE